VGLNGKGLRSLGSRVQIQRSTLPTLTPGSWRHDGMTSGQRGYDYAWQKRRAMHLRANPLCAYCLDKGLVEPATVADHITPHRGDPDLFNGPLQSLCASCHSSDKAKQEGRGG
jgi:5-methylcytosine-specific restriction enzyme A